MSGKVPQGQTAASQNDQKQKAQQPSQQSAQPQLQTQNTTQLDNSKPNKNQTNTANSTNDNVDTSNINQSKQPVEKKNLNDSNIAGDMKDTLVQSQLVPNSQDDYKKKLETLKTAQQDIVKTRHQNDKKRKELKILADLLEQEIQKTLKKKNATKPFDPKEYKSDKLDELKKTLDKQVLENKKLKEDIQSMQQLEQFNDAIHKIAGLKNKLREKENYYQELDKTKEFLEGLKKKHELLIEGLSNDYKYKEKKEQLNKEISDHKKKLKELQQKDLEKEKIYIQKNEQLQQLKEHYRVNAQKQGFIGNPLEGYDLFKLNPADLNNMSELEKTKLEKKKRKEEKDKKLIDMYDKAKIEEDQKKSNATQGGVTGGEPVEKSKAGGKGNAPATNNATGGGQQGGPRKLFYTAKQNEVDKSKLKRSDVDQEEFLVKEQREELRQLEKEAITEYEKLIDDKVECNPQHFDKVVLVLREKIAQKVKQEKEFAKEIEKLEHDYKNAQFERNQIQDKLDKREIETNIVVSQANGLRRIIQHQSEPNVIIAASQILKQSPVVDKKIFIKNQLIHSKRRGVTRDVQGYMFSDKKYHIFDDSELMSNNLDSKITKIIIYLYQGIIIGIKTFYQLKELIAPPKQQELNKTTDNVDTSLVVDKQQAGDSQNKQKQDNKDKKNPDENKDKNANGDNSDAEKQTKPKEEYTYKEIVCFPKFIDEQQINALEGQTDIFEKQELVIEENDFLKSISGIFTHKIEYLKFETNAGRIMKGGRLGFHQQSEEFRIDIKRNYTPIALFGAFIHKPKKEKKKDLNTSQLQNQSQVTLDQQKVTTVKVNQPQQQNVNKPGEQQKQGNQPTQQQQQPQKQQQQVQQSPTKPVTDVQNPDQPKQDKVQDNKFLNIKEICLVAIGIEIRLPFDPLRLPYFENAKKRQKDEIEEEILSIDEDDDENKEIRKKRLEMQRKIRYKLKKSPRNSLSAKKIQGSTVGGYKNQYTEKLAKIAGLSLYNSQKEEEFYKQKGKLDQSKDQIKDKDAAKDNKNAAQKDKDKAAQDKQPANKDKKPEDNKNAKENPPQQKKK